MKAVIILLILFLIISLLLYDPLITGGAETTYSIVLICKMPIQVQEIRKKYIKHDNLPPHVTLGYLRPDFDSKFVLKQLRQFRGMTIKFNNLKVSPTFLALTPADVSKLNNMSYSITDELQSGPRGGYHLSLAYRRPTGPLSPAALMHVRRDIKLPIEARVTEIRIAKRKPGEHWKKYKSIQF